MILDEDQLKLAADLIIVIQYMLEEEGVKLMLTDQAKERARVKMRELGWEDLKIKDLFFE